MDRCELESRLPDRPASRHPAGAPTLLTVLLLLALVPGAAACAYIESDVLPRSAIGDTTRRAPDRDVSATAQHVLATAVATVFGTSTGVFPPESTVTLPTEAPIANVDALTLTHVALERLHDTLCNLPPPVLV
ncbi:MAG: hypothetical protein AAFX05_10525 [Planctomycetota bacterium]